MTLNQNVVDLGGTHSPGRGPSHLSPSHRSHSPREFKRVKHNSAEPGPNKYVSPDDLIALRFAVYQMVDVILDGESLSHSYQWCYNQVHSLCRAKYSEQTDLGSRIFAAISSYYNTKVGPALTEVLEGLDDIATKVETFLDVFNEYRERLFTLKKLFLYFDNSYLLSHPSKMGIVQYGYSKAHDSLLDLTSQRSNLLLNLLDDLLAEARQEMVVLEPPSPGSKYALATKLARTIKELTPIASPDINRAIFKAMKQTCAEMRPLLFETYSHQYFYTVLTILSEEISIFTKCGYSPEFLRELRRTLLWEYFFYDFSYVLDQALTPVVHQNCTSLLKVLVLASKEAYDYFGINATKILRFKFLEVVKREMDSEVSQLKTSGSKTAIVTISASIDKFKELAAQMATKTESGFDIDVRTAISHVFARPEYNDYLLQQLSKYCDSFVKSETGQGADSASLVARYQNFIKITITIFNYFKSKADFISIYKKDLSRRLLLARSFSPSSFVLEDLIVESFKDIIGFSDELTSISGMLTDFKLSKQQYSQVPGLELDFSALVLDSRNWPEVPKNDKSIIVPELLQSTLNTFSDNYKLEVKQNAKVLDWTSYSLHQITLTTSFDDGDKDLYINLLQAVVLLLFQDKDSYDFDEIHTLTNIENRLLKVILASFTTEKYKILLVDNHKYTFNRQFTDRASKIRLPISRDREVSVKPTANKVVVDRLSEVRAAIARIMKDKRTINYVDLISEAILLIEKRGQVTVAEVKKNIENLIEFNLIERQLDSQTLIYIP